MWEYKHQIYISSMGRVPHVHLLTMVIAGAREVIVSYVTSKTPMIDEFKCSCIDSYDIAVYFI